MRQFNEQQRARINDVLYHIHRDLSARLTAQELAAVAAYSPHHFHRIFKLVTGENVNDYIRRTRLESAANLLVFNPDLAILEIALRCGFRSPATFTHAFKERFDVTPSMWRQGGYHNYCARHNYPASDHDVAEAFSRISDQPLPKVEIRQLPPQRVAYVRHQGYDRSITDAWHYLQAWAYEEALEWSELTMLGLYHSNPAIVPLTQCRYVACISVGDSVWRRGPVGILTIPGGTHAVLRAEGRYGEFLPRMQQFMQQWLPDSGYRLGMTPAYTRYIQNPFLDPDECFKLEFCVPLRLV